MSELLTDTRKYIELAEQVDVYSLRQYLFNDPNNLGGFDKRLFRNNVRFQKDFKQYGSLSL